MILNSGSIAASGNTGVTGINPNFNIGVEDISIDSLRNPFTGLSEETERQYQLFRQETAGIVRGSGYALPSMVTALGSNPAILYGAIALGAIFLVRMLKSR